MPHLSVLTVPKPTDVPEGKMKFPCPKFCVPKIFDPRQSAVAALARVVDAVAENLEKSPDSLKRAVIGSLGGGGAGLPGNTKFADPPERASVRARRVA